MPTLTGPGAGPGAGPRPGGLDRDQAVATVLARLAARRSAWNPADARGEVEKAIAATGLVATAAVRIELAEDLTQRVIDQSTPLLRRRDVPEHIRSYSSDHVLAVEAEIVTRLAHRAEATPQPGVLLADHLPGPQWRSARLLVGAGDLVVVEGAAGAGKTTTLRAVAETMTVRRQRMLIATPTLKAAQVAARETGTTAVSVAWLLHQHGYRWDADGHWTRLQPVPRPSHRAGPGDPADRVLDDRAVLYPGDLLVVDEAGMLDQDSAHALLTIADETRARVALVGDRHQLPAVGRGGVLDLAHRWANPDALVSLDQVHRFADPEYAAISLALRIGSPSYRCEPTSETPSKPAGEPAGERVGEAPSPAIHSATPCPTSELSGARTREVFGRLVERGQIRIHASKAERTQALAQLAADQWQAGRSDFLLIADTREQVAALNGAIRDRLVTTGHVDDQRAVTTRAGERIGIGDRVTTRLNDRHWGVANRDTWTVTHISDLHVVLQGRRGQVRSVPLAYAHRHLELGYATTAHGAQGETVHSAHMVLGEHTSAASAYVGMTRGRDHNTAHLVAVDLDDARRQWDETYARDRADLGPGIAGLRAAEDIERYGPNRTPRPAHPGPRRTRRTRIMTPDDEPDVRRPQTEPGISL